MTPEECIDFLKIHGKNIGELGSQGDKVCIQIMTYYRMLEKSQDGMTWVLLGEEIKKYQGKGVV